MTCPVAVFSDEGKPRGHRYFLRRAVSTMFDAGTVKPLVICGYNPSDANETADDPTIRREIDFAKQWGCSHLLKFNMFAGVGNKPEMLDDIEDPVGAANDAWIVRGIAYAVEHGGILLAAWGVPKGSARVQALARERAKMLAALGPWTALKVTKDGHPSHPLYLKKTSKPLAWSAPA